MSTSPIPSCDDYISTEELFQSFMDVALIAEQEINVLGGGQEHTEHEKNAKNIHNVNSEISYPTKDEQLEERRLNHGYTEIAYPLKENSLNGSTSNNNEVTMPLPLMLKRTADPIYESVSGQNNTSFTSSNGSAESASDNTSGGVIVTVASSPTRNYSYPVPDYPADAIVVNEAECKGSVEKQYSNDRNSGYDVVIDNTAASRPVSDIYAVVDMQKKKKDRQEQQQQQQPPSDVDDSCQYAKVDKSRTNTNKHIDVSPVVSLDENKAQIRHSDTYETIVSITPSAHVTTDKEPKTLPLSEYAIIDSQENQHAPLKASNSDYESVSELKLDLIEQGFTAQPHDGELSPEIIAFGFHSQRLHTENQAKLYETCLSTIDRGARNSEKKRHFFGFGKSKHPV